MSGSPLGPRTRRGGTTLLGVLCVGGGLLDGLDGQRRVVVLSSLLQGKVAVAVHYLHLDIAAATVCTEDDFTGCARVLVVKVVWIQTLQSLHNFNLRFCRSFILARGIRTFRCERSNLLPFSCNVGLGLLSRCWDIILVGAALFFGAVSLDAE